MRLFLTDSLTPFLHPNSRGLASCLDGVIDLGPLAFPFLTIMVVSTNSDVYSPLQYAMNQDEGAQTSEGGSGLHSPTHFGTSFSSPHGDSFRYQHDSLEVQRAAAIVAPQYDYATSLNLQQPPLLDTPLELPSPSAQHVTFSGHYPVALPHRDHIPHDFPVQSVSNSRLPSAHTGGSIDLRYTSPSEQRLPGGPSHDHSYPRQARVSSGMPMEGDRKPPPMPSSSEHKEPSTNPPVASGSREPRKEISTVVIACRQCRSRKIRCDSTRPVCHNCVRRSNVCEYDSVPKRRGPDKNPGTRQRSCKKRPADGSAPPPSKRKRTAIDRSADTRDTAPSTSKIKENMASDNRTQSSPRHAERPHDARPQERLQHPSASPIELRITTEGLSPVVHEQSPMSRRNVPYSLDQHPYIHSSFPRQLDVNIMRSPHTQHQKFPTSPTVKQTQKVWWSTFLSMFSLRDVERDLTYLFQDTGYWLCFLNLDYFVRTLLDEELRLSIQPAFIYAGLAMATLMKSSEVEFKAPGRERALWLRNTAQTHLESSMASEWIDASLAEAALILALFETSAHPMYNPDRVEQALLTLDFIIRTTSLTTIDAHDPDVVRYPAGCVPVVHLDPLGDESAHKKCTCIPPDAAQAPNPFSSWSYILPWDPTWTDPEIRDEGCRRLCWSALSLVCNYVSQCVAFDRAPPDFFLTDCANYALLFPGEVLDRVAPTYRGSTSPSTKESVWALYCRSMLLWTSTNRLRTSAVPDDEKVELVYEAWAEAQALQDSLRIHDCNLDTALMYMCREYVYNTQITITQTLRSLQGLGSGPPIFKRKHAEEWLWYQDRVIQIVRAAISHLGGVQGYQLTRRPYQVMWFANQLSICLVLWNYDRSLKNALVLAKSILFPVEVMTSLWPCPALQRQSDDLRRRLIEACNAEGMEPPMPTNYTLPSLSL
ncbi:putative GAL4-like Zn(II)2Cys6 (or C6 zinc) binuclear cluster DNA-binding domain [Lyophyllum shimeji]|uniref:GAL4-like Zn(II)2Cys6 (Or C6 zinc) binuclear cluster DNA-binding domain n=1 Tax=Lyophyllum shimeji TaxID=47721 RepID=A0A9P3URD0_LYOSH|nr:putative GAL4-like Zn(II)2Cys6 (or C6 zinc) binuclear cluster DNA-binding domain [Lyophyllum shimeji]